MEQEKKNIVSQFEESFNNSAFLDEVCLFDFLSYFSLFFFFLNILFYFLHIINLQIKKQKKQKKQTENQSIRRRKSRSGE